jgi:hypothetical protein
MRLAGSEKNFLSPSCLLRADTERKVLPGQWLSYNRCPPPRKNPAPSLDMVGAVREEAII